MWILTGCVLLGVLSRLEEGEVEVWRGHTQDPKDEGREEDDEDGDDDDDDNDDDDVEDNNMSATDMTMMVMKRSNDEGIRW